MASGMVWYWRSYNVIGDQFSPSVSWLHFLLIKLAFRVQNESKNSRPTSELYIQQGRAYTLMPAFLAKYSFFHCLFWGRCPLLNLSLYQGGIGGSDWVRVLLLCESGVESFPRPIGWEWRRMMFWEENWDSVIRKDGSEDYPPYPNCLFVFALPFRTVLSLETSAVIWLYKPKDSSLTEIWMLPTSVWKR